MKTVIELNRNEIVEAILQYLKDELPVGTTPPTVEIQSDKEYPCLTATVRAKSF